VGLIARGCEAGRDIGAEKAFPLAELLARIDQVSGGDAT
jgi:hypothetical protein